MTYGDAIKNMEDIVKAKFTAGTLKVNTTALTTGLAKLASDNKYQSFRLDRLKDVLDAQLPAQNTLRAWADMLRGIMMELGKLGLSQQASEVFTVSFN